MDAEESKSDISSSDESQEENEKELQAVEEIVQKVARPEYQPGELSQLVCYLKDMVFLFDLRDCDWNHEVLSVIERWFLENQQPLLFVFYSPENVLSGCLGVPVQPFFDATYFIRQPNEIFQVDSFHDTIQYGTMQDPDESLLVLMESIYGPYFFRQPLEWSERVRVNFLETLDNFMTNLTDLHYKMSGLTILAMPPMEEEINIEDEFTVRRLEKLIIHWMGQIRLFLGDGEAKELLCPSDFYDFWVYREEVLQALILQFEKPEVETVLSVLEAKQSIYIKQFKELIKDCLQEEDRAEDNIKFLSLLIDPCKKLEECPLPSDIPVLLPRILRLILYIQRKSKYLRGSTIVDLFRSLTNHIILFCRSKIHILEILEDSPREGIKMCSMSIDCCLAYREIYNEILSDSQEDFLDPLMIFNPIDTFIERLNDMILICEYSDINSRVAPQFGGTWGREFEETCTEMRRIFREALSKIKDEKDLALDVTKDRWATAVISQFKNTLKELDEIFQNMIRTAFIYCRNTDDRIEILCTLISYQNRDSLSQCFNEYVDKLYEDVMAEISSTKQFILQERARKRRYALCENYSGFGFFLLANLKRTQRLKSCVLNLFWLRRQECPESVRLEMEIVEKLIQQDIQSNFEAWKMSIPDDMINCLQRPLLVRSLSRPGLLECNIDRNLVVLLREANIFKKLHFPTPINITQLFQKFQAIMSVFESTVTMCLDYNLIVVSLTEKERLLFKPLIKACDKKITAGIYKLNWAGELSDTYASECLQLTAQIYGFLLGYKLTNMRIVEICEQICQQEVMQIYTRELSELANIEDKLRVTASTGCERLVQLYREIVEQIVAVHDGFAVYQDGPLLVKSEGIGTGTGNGAEGENPEWCEYVKKIDRLLEKAFGHCVQRNLQSLVQQICGNTSLRIIPFVKVQVILEGNHLQFQPEIQNISIFLGSLFVRLVAQFKVFRRLQEHLRIPTRGSAGRGSFFETLKTNERCLAFHNVILKEIQATEAEIGSYATRTWSPFQGQWSIDKLDYMAKFNETEPTPEHFHSIISKYAEIANQISLQNDEDSRLSIRYVQLNVSALKGSIIEHIDEWQRLHIDLLARRTFAKLDKIYEEIAALSGRIEVQPVNREEMLETLKLHELIQHTEIPGLEVKFEEVRNHFRIMDIHNVAVPVDHQKRLKGLDGTWEAFLDKFKEVVETLQTSKDQFG